MVHQRPLRQLPRDRRRLLTCPWLPAPRPGPARWDLLPGRTWAGFATGADRLRLVRGANCRTAAALFAEWARTLAFPGYFGHNWPLLTLKSSCRGG
ncbi:barstar family protein [Streptomyces sp. TLI_053]|uniref:barstar family protein n=1 Tax=Streptomyces sp. TLI_053 TaxID=1855352 RepID=UPI000B88639C